MNRQVIDINKKMTIPPLIQAYENGSSLKERLLEAIPKPRGAGHKVLKGQICTKLWLISPLCH